MKNIAMRSTHTKARSVTTPIVSRPPERGTSNDGPREELRAMRIEEKSTTAMVEIMAIRMNEVLDTMAHRANAIGMITMAAGRKRNPCGLGAVSGAYPVQPL